MIVPSTDGWLWRRLLIWHRWFLEVQPPPPLVGKGAKLADHGHHPHALDESPGGISRSSILVCWSSTCATLHTNRSTDTPIISAAIMQQDAHCTAGVEPHGSIDWALSDAWMSSDQSCVSGSRPFSSCSLVTTPCVRKYGTMCVISVHRVRPGHMGPETNYVDTKPTSRGSHAQEACLQ